MKYWSLLFLLFSIHVFAKDVDLGAMSEHDKNLTGLYKLSADELEALEDWLNRKQQKQVRVEKQQQAGFEHKQLTEREVISTTLKKVYQDQLGNTYYHLTNGQVWKKTQSGRINIDKGDGQEVTLIPKAFGSWMIKGKGNRSVKVKRVR